MAGGVCVCVCVCVRERERETETERDRDRDRERQRSRRLCQREGEGSREGPEIPVVTSADIFMLLNIKQYLPPPQ